MRDRTAVMMGMAAGALAGGVAGWLWLTRDGQRLRAQIEPRLQEFANQALAVGESARRVQTAARESWDTMQDVAGGTEP